MGAIASQITSLTIVYSTVYSHADQRKHQSSASLDFVRGIHRWLVNSPHKWPVTRKMFPFDDVIMGCSKVDPWFHPPKVLFHDYFSPSGEQLEQRILSYKQNNRLCSNISQILLLYKVWGYYNKFYSMKYLGIYHWYVRLPRLRIYYVLCSKTYRSFGGLFWAPAGSRRTSRDARICETSMIIYLNHTEAYLGTKSRGVCRLLWPQQLKIA